MRKFILAIALAATIAPVTIVSADPPPWSNAGGKHKHKDKHDDRADWRRYDYNRPDPRYRSYDAYRYYRADPSYRERRLTRADRIYRGSDNRYYCRRSDGTTGLIVGALAGGVLGSALAGSGSNTLGALLGAGGGALIGRSIDRGDVRCR